jgi:GST-like protein
VIELFFATSVNVYKIMIAMEEMGLEYELNQIDISKGDQLDPSKMAGSPTKKVPVIRDNAPADGGAPLVVFESGAILQYLADKSGMLLPNAPRARLEATQWLFWQVANLGPISGQAWHFHAFAQRIAPEIDNRYSRDRYFHMMSALWTVLNTRLSTQDYVAGDYSIADIACFPWIIYFDPPETMSQYPNIERWRDRVAARPAVRRAYTRVAALKTDYVLNDKGMFLYPWEGIMEHMITV